MSTYLYDKNLFLATAQAVTGSAVTKDSVRVGEKVSNGDTMYAVTEVTTAFTDGTGTNTMTIDIQSSDATGSGFASSTISAALDMTSYSAGDLIVLPIPANTGSYLRVVYTPGSVGAYTAGAISTFVTPAFGYNS